MLSPFHLLHQHMGSLLDAFEHETYPSYAYGYEPYSAPRASRRPPAMYRALYDPTPSSLSQPHYHLIDFSLPMTAEEQQREDGQEAQQRIKAPHSAQDSAANVKQQQVQPAGNEHNQKQQQQQQQLTTQTQNASEVDPINNLFRSLFRPAAVNVSSELAPLEKLRVNVSEDQHGMIIQAEVAGLSKDDVQLTVKDQVLTIKATKKSEKEHAEGEDKTQPQAVGTKADEEMKRGEENPAQPAAAQPQTSNKPSEPSHRVLHRELHYGSVSRSIRLPRQADISQISASAKDGLLTVRVPYKQHKEPEQRTISINSAM